MPITTAYHACVTGDLSTAEELLTQKIHTDTNNYTSYPRRVFNWGLLTQDIHTDANDHTSYARRFFNREHEALFLTTYQKRCKALLSEGKPDKALEVYKYMMDAIDESAKASCLVWSNGKSAVRDVM
jgi:hypothetical protein